MKSSYPTFDEYQAVLQSPQHCFGMQELKNGQVETDLWGLPRVRSGGFALTYKLSGASRALAVRCFHRNVPDRILRYAAISRFLSSTPSNILVPIHYLPNGILVRGNWYPVTYMKWIDGETLDAYIVKNLRSRGLIQQCAQEFLRVVAELENLGIAHGDLSHRNILLSHQKMLLVDYDGMYVPALQGMKSCEIGNIHFQHPGRAEAHFNAELDRFSELVIYLALAGLAHDPSLLERYETGGEGLLFSRADFLNPYASRLLQELETNPALSSLVRQFRQVSTAEIRAVPRLADVIAARPLELPRREALPAQPPEATFYDANQRLKLLVKAGKVVTVVGKISDWHTGISKEGKPHIYLNFGYWRLKCFTVIVLDEVIQLFAAFGKKPEDYLDQWIRVNGVLTVFGHRPQIQINSPTDLHILKGEAEANALITGSLDARQGPAPVRDAVLPLQAAPGIHQAPRPSDNIRGSMDQTREVQERVESLYAHWKKLPTPPRQDE